MKTGVKLLVMLLLTFSLPVVVPAGHGHHGKPEVVPPRSHVHGLTYAQWSNLSSRVRGRERSGDVLSYAQSGPVRPRGETAPRSCCGGSSARPSVSTSSDDCSRRQMIRMAAMTGTDRNIPATPAISPPAITPKITSAGWISMPARDDQRADAVVLDGPPHEEEQGEELTGADTRRTDSPRR